MMLFQLATSRAGLVALALAAGLALAWWLYDQGGQKAALDATRQALEAEVEANREIEEIQRRMRDAVRDRSRDALIERLRRHEY